MQSLITWCGNQLSYQQVLILCETCWVSVSMIVSIFVRTNDNYISLLTTVVDALCGISVVALSTSISQRCGFIMNIIYLNTSVWTLVGFVIFIVEDINLTLVHHVDIPIRLGIHIAMAFLNTGYTVIMIQKRPDLRITADFWTMKAMLQRITPWHTTAPQSTTNSLFMKYTLEGIQPSSDWVVNAFGIIAWFVGMVELIAQRGCRSNPLMAIILACMIWLLGIVFVLELVLANVGINISAYTIFHNLLSSLLHKIRSTQQYVIRLPFPSSSQLPFISIWPRIFLWGCCVVVWCSVICVAFVFPFLHSSIGQYGLWFYQCTWPSFTMLCSMGSIAMISCYWSFKYAILWWI